MPVLDDIGRFVAFPGPGDTSLTASGDQMPANVAGGTANIGVSVDSKGALGNGVTDDTAAFNSAFAAVGSGGTVLIGPKTYVVNDVEFTADGQRIAGAGRLASTIIARSGATQALGLKGFVGCALSDLTLDGNGRASKGLYAAATAGATVQTTLLSRVRIQNCSIGIHVDNVGLTQADKLLALSCEILNNTIGYQCDSVNGQEAVFISVNCGMNINNQIGFKLSAAGGGATLGILGGQVQGNGVATGLTGIQVTGTSLGWIWLKDFIDQNVQTSIDASATCPLYGIHLDHATLQGATANILLGPINAGTIGGTVYARLSRFNNGAGASGAGVIKGFSTDAAYTGGRPRVVLEDCNNSVTVPTLNNNGGGSTTPLSLGEAPRQIGTAGNPAFGADFANAAVGGQPLSFWMDRNGDVNITGTITTPAGQASNTTIFTLPAGYRCGNATGAMAQNGVAYNLTATSVAPLYAHHDGTVAVQAAIGAGANVILGHKFSPLSG